MIYIAHVAQLWDQVPLTTSSKTITITLLSPFSATWDPSEEEGSSAILRILLWRWRGCPQPSLRRPFRATQRKGWSISGFKTCLPIMWQSSFQEVDSVSCSLEAGQGLWPPWLRLQQQWNHRTSEAELEKAIQLPPAFFLLGCLTLAPSCHSVRKAKPVRDIACRCSGQQPTEILAIGNSNCETW